MATPMDWRFHRECDLVLKMDVFEHGVHSKKWAMKNVPSGKLT